MGLSIAPLYFTKLVRVMARFLRTLKFKNGVKFLSKFGPAAPYKLLVYLDDVLVLMRESRRTNARI